MVPKDFFCLKGASPNVNHILGLGNSGFYSVGGMFPNHWGPVFQSIADNLFQTVGMRLGFHFIGVKVGVGVGINTDCKIL